MGLNFGYLLYFKREHLWKTLQGFVTLAERFDPPTKLFFPDRTLDIPLEPLSAGNDGYKFDESEMAFFTCIPFDEDFVLAELSKSNEVNKNHRSPPESQSPEKVTICEIILTIHQNLAEDLNNQYVLFEFDAVGTWMSLLFEKSPSIRTKFLSFLKENKGISGVFNYEFGGGEVIWHQGKHYKVHIEDQFILPDEIDAILN